MEKRAFLAVVLSLIVLIAYQEWVARYYAPQPPPAKVEKPQEKQPAQAVPEIKPALPPAPALAQEQAQEVRVETDKYSAVFTSRGGRLKSFLLRDYRTSIEEHSPPVEMISHQPEISYPLGIRLNGAAQYDDEELTYAVLGGDLKLTGDAKGSLGFEARTPAGAVIRKEFTFTGSSYAVGMDVTVTGSPSAAALLVTAPTKGPAADTKFEGFLALVDRHLIRQHDEELKKGQEFTGTVSWAGFGYTYFLFAVLPETTKEEKVTVKETDSRIAMEIALKSPDRPTFKNHYTLFIGPKEFDVLASFGRELERSIDFGWALFRFFSVPLLQLMHFSHQFTGSYGIDIILITVLIKLLTAPLTHKSFVSMKQMQKLQPQMERLKEKFKDDREKLNREIMELYRRNKVNPLGGCLPMILQIPVFIGLYNALLTPIELRHAPFLWIKDLSRPDWESLPFHLGGWSVGLPLLTILMGASMFLQQWMTPSAGDPNQRRMMLMMPILFTVMFINFPSGLTIYWLVNNILSIAQQYVVNRMDRWK
ncbi:MAG TPA: membrane protein insertase YidC [Candidatus Acidoferrales bacterium]|nr:membrane protein insertase YidC [Candidatus Acidoferrales bacterium]